MRVGPAAPRSVWEIDLSGVKGELSFRIPFSAKRVLGVAPIVPRADERFPKMSSYLPVVLGKG